VPTTDPAALAWLFYTSGLHRTVEGAMLSHRNLMAMTLSHPADFDDPDENCSLIHGALMSHGLPLHRALRTAWGAPRYRSRRHSNDEFLDLCDHHPAAASRPHHGGAVGGDGRPRPQNLRTVVTAVARCTWTA
jgi:acyl-CoA synthetase (AMP-forming)/AMP-acid ligase II